MMRRGFLLRLRGGHHRPVALLRATVGLRVPVDQRGRRRRLSRRRRDKVVVVLFAHPESNDLATCSR